MGTTQITETIKSYFRNQPVSAVFLFGSYARGEQNQTSDIDIIIIPDKTLSLFTLGGYKSDLEDITGHAVDVIPQDSLDPLVKPYIQKDLIKIYERPI